MSALCQVIERPKGGYLVRAFHKTTAGKETYRIEHYGPFAERAEAEARSKGELYLPAIAEPRGQ
jgi:hypothetical protein